MMCLVKYNFVILCADALSWVARLSQKYGSVYYMWFALDLTVFVTDLEYLKVSFATVVSA